MGFTKNLIDRWEGDILGFHYCVQHLFTLLSNSSFFAIFCLFACLHYCCCNITLSGFENENAEFGSRESGFSQQLAQCSSEKQVVDTEACRMIWPEPQHRTKHFQNPLDLCLCSQGSAQPVYPKAPFSSILPSPLGHPMPCVSFNDQAGKSVLPLTHR